MPPKIAIQLEAFAELRGSVPDVPFAEGVNYDELVAADLAKGQKPMFVTLPLAQFGQVSRNRRRYSESEVRRMYSRIMQSAVTGALGHLRDDERSFAFEVPAVKWVGASIEGNQLWGKLYVLSHKDDLREYFRVQKASGGRVGTSLYALGYEEYDPEAEVWDVSELELEQIDVVHPDRVGVLFAATMAPHITSETLAEEASAVPEDTEAPLDEEVPIDQETTEEDMATQPNTPSTTTETDVDSRIVAMTEAHQAEVRKLQAELNQLKSDTRALNRVREMLSVKEGQDVVLALQAEQSTMDVLRRENLELLDTAIKAEVSNLVPVEWVRGMVESIIRDRKPQTRGDVVSFVQEALAQEHIATILKNAVQKEMGPKVETSKTPAGETPNSSNDLFILVPGMEG
jgi:hypothetical protein